MVSFVTNPQLRFTINQTVAWLVDAAVTITASPQASEELRREFAATLISATRGERPRPQMLPPDGTPVVTREIFYDPFDPDEEEPLTPPPVFRRPPFNNHRCEAFTRQGSGQCLFEKARGLRVCAAHLQYWEKYRQLPHGGATRPYLPE